MLYMAGDLPQALGAFEQAAKNGENTAGELVPSRDHSGQAQQLKPAKDAYERFLAYEPGKNPNQEFQARQRERIIQQGD